MTSISQMFRKEKKKDVHSYTLMHARGPARSPPRTNEYTTTHTTSFSRRHIHPQTGRIRLYFRCVQLCVYVCVCGPLFRFHHASVIVIVCVCVYCCCCVFFLKYPFRALFYLFSFSFLPFTSQYERSFKLSLWFFCAPCFFAVVCSFFFPSFGGVLVFFFRPPSAPFLPCLSFLFSFRVRIAGDRLGEASPCHLSLSTLPCLPHRHPSCYHSRFGKEGPSPPLCAPRHRPVDIRALVGSFTEQCTVRVFSTKATQLQGAVRLRWVSSLCV